MLPFQPLEDYCIYVQMYYSYTRSPSKYFQKNTLMVFQWSKQQYEATFTIKLSPSAGHRLTRNKLLSLRLVGMEHRNIYLMPCQLCSPFRSKSQRTNLYLYFLTQGMSQQKLHGTSWLLGTWTRGIKIVSCACVFSKTRPYNLAEYFSQSL